jgi:hypothetical protein
MKTNEQFSVGHNARGVTLRIFVWGMGISCMSCRVISSLRYNRLTKLSSERFNAFNNHRLPFTWDCGNRVLKNFHRWDITEMILLVSLIVD